MDTNKKISVTFGMRKLLTTADASFHHFSKGAILALLLLSLISPTSAQKATRAQSCVTACGQAGNVSYSIGQTFFSQTMNPSCGSETAAGVQQAQLLHETIDTALCQNDVKPIYGFDFHSLDADGNLIPAGRYDSSHYTPSYLNYDSLTEISLTVWPIYEGYDTLHLTYQEMLDAGFDKPGRNDKLLRTVNDCDSLLHYMVYVCQFPEENVADGDNNTYNNVWVGDECWTASNLRTTKDMAGNDVPSMVYQSMEYTNPTLMENTYGRLYTWHAAVAPSLNNEGEFVRSADGYVQGICPKGWHLPTNSNMADLNNYPADWLRSNSYWLHPGSDRIDLDVRPAGWYNADNRRFENLLGYTYFWSDETVNLQIAHECTFMDGCNDVLIEERLKNYGLSVRCVKDDVYSDTQWTEQLRKEPLPTEE